MYGEMDVNNDYEDDWGGWQNTQNTRKRHMPSSSNEGHYARRPRLDNSQSGGVPPLLPPPLPPISQVTQLPSAFLEFSRRLYNSTIADMGLENPAELFSDRASASQPSYNYGEQDNHSAGRFGSGSREFSSTARGRGFRQKNQNAGRQSFSRGGGNSEKRWSTIGGDNEVDWGDYSKPRYNQSNSGRGQRGRGRGGRGSSFGSQQKPARGGGRGRGGAQQRGGGNSYMASRGASRGAAVSTRGFPNRSVGNESQIPRNLTIAEKIRRFCAFIKNEPLKFNAIQTIENALTACKLQLTASYNVEEVVKFSSSTKFTGCLTLAGHFLVRAVGPSKKELKHEIYTKALEVLKKRSVVEILCLIDPGVEAIRTEAVKHQAWKDPTGGKVMGEVKNTTVAHEPGVSSVVDAHSHVATGPADTKKGLTTLLTYMKDSPVTAENCIAVVEQSISQSRCGLKSEFTCVAHTQLSGRRVFKGIVKLAKISIAQGHGLNKRDAKHDAYTNVLAALTSKTADVLLSGRQVEGYMPDGSWEELEYFPMSTDQNATKRASAAAAKAALDMCKAPNLTQQMACLTNTLKDVPGKTNNVNSIDCLSVQLGLTPVCYYKKIKPGNDQPSFLRCELYINDILVGSADGNVKKDAQINAYDEAFKLLTTCPSHYIVKNQPRRSSTDPPDPDIIERVVKGAGKLGDSNMDRLQRHDINVYENWKSPDDLIIMEYVDLAEDREKHGFHILIQSATLSEMLLEWTFAPKQSLTNECTVTLQRSVTSTVSCSSKMSARNKACAEILNQYYSNVPIVQMERQGHSQPRPWEELREAAGQWTVPTKYSGPLELPTNSEHAEKVDPEDELTVKYVFNELDEYQTKNTLDEIAFGPELPFASAKAISHHARSLSLRSESRHAGGKLAFIHVTKKLFASEIVQYLELNDGRSGKFHLYTDPVKPYIDIKPVLVKPIGTEFTAGNRQGFQATKSLKGKQSNKNFGNQKSGNMPLTVYSVRPGPSGKQKKNTQSGFNNNSRSKGFSNKQQYTSSYSSHFQSTGFGGPAQKGFIDTSQTNMDYAEDPSYSTDFQAGNSQFDFASDQNFSDFEGKYDYF